MKMALSRMPPSSWVTRWSEHISRGGRVLDVASGNGRHARWLAAAGYRTEAVDRNITQLADLAGVQGITVRRLDLEACVWPYAPASFSGIVVTNYLYRPLSPYLLAALARDGVLIYETFAMGNGRYGRPRNPNYLLQPGELLAVVAGRLEVLGFDEGTICDPHPAVVQRLCARMPKDPTLDSSVF